MDKIRSLFAKYKDILVYLFFGVLTSLVDFLVFIPLHKMLGVSAAVSNTAAWTAAGIFAFFTNKIFVFKSASWSAANLLQEFWKFILCRVGTFLMEEVFLFVTADLLSYDGIVMKLLISVAVVILNYVGSKLFVFRKKQG